MQRLKRTSIEILICLIVFMFLVCNSSWGLESVNLQGESSVPSIKHVKVYFEKNRFGGWPANHGIWIWGNEILVGFSAGDYKDLGQDRHNIDREKPESHLFARSIDGGETWQIEDSSKDGVLLPEGKMLHGTELPGVVKPVWRDCPGGIDFKHSGFAMTLRMTDSDKGPSRFYYSYDRGKHWEGPFRLPDMGTSGVAARTDMIVVNSHECLFFLTAAKADGQEGRPFCARTVDGGKTFEFLSWIGQEPEGYAIMPSSVRLSKNELFSVIRCSGKDHSRLAAYRSKDNGLHWDALQDPVADTGEGNPPSLIKLNDGRLCLTYGVRSHPYRMCAKLSSEHGDTWGEEIVLRDDGSSRDIGYPRSVQRPDGKVVTIYYFSDAKTGAERYIAATIWDPNSFKEISTQEDSNE